MGTGSLGASSAVERPAGETLVVTSRQPGHHVRHHLDLSPDERNAAEIVDRIHAAACRSYRSTARRRHDGG
jgi:hypothetical protein